MAEPSELLATIFTHILEEQVFDRCRGIHRGMHRQGLPTWEIVTHVCRHWRQVALACPTLWTFIDHAPARRLSIMLERSKTAALIVFYTSSHLHCIGQALSQLPRIKVLHLCACLWNVDHISDCLSSQPAPLLEIFELYAVEPGLDTISDAIFQGRAPRLRSVVLTQCTFSWTSSIFSGLPTLNLRRIHVPTLLQLLSVLRRMPGLEQLMFEELSTSSGGAEVFDQVPLTRLKSIALNSSTVQSAISLFSHLALPVDVKITLDLTQLERPQSFYDLLSVMYKNPNESSPVIQSLRIDLEDDPFYLQLSTSIWNPHIDDARLSIHFLCDTSTIQPAIIFDICRMFPHRCIQGLFVAYSLDPPEDFWGCAEFREFASVRLNCNDIGGLITTLQSRGAQSSDIVYPELHALELTDVNFGCDQLEALRDIITMRAKRGLGIHKLRLVQLSAEI
ncbi:hypothetical protein DFH29DRAFT_949556 [Suillus ampliporus]|nr:hypothetical protein DFH29DRAFT_949556 [Suillus ampliporus]